MMIAQSGCCTFVPRRSNKTRKLDQVEISFAQKNKWEDDWVQYWFYAKIAFPGECGGLRLFLLLGRFDSLSTSINQSATRLLRSFLNVLPRLELLHRY